MVFLFVFCVFQKGTKSLPHHQEEGCIRQTSVKRLPRSIAQLFIFHPQPASEVPHQQKGLRRHAA